MRNPFIVALLKLGLDRLKHCVCSLHSQSEIMSAIIYTTILFLINGYKKVERILFRIYYPIVKWVVVYLFRRYGLELNGKSEIDPQVKKENEREFLLGVANQTPMGLGEGYMDGLWKVKNLDAFWEYVFKRRAYKIYYFFPANRIYNYLLFDVCNLQTRERAWEVAEHHYDLGNQLFESFLDPSMNYSCGYWKTAKTLEEAQQDKMDLIGRKLKLKPGMRLLDIGCGWGGLCKYLAQNFKVHVVGCTVSKEQQQRTRESCKGADVDIQLIDYRNVSGKFDRVVSIAMFEAVGVKNFKEFFQFVQGFLKPNGLFLLHTIGISDPSLPRIEPWFHKYIFPNGMLPYDSDIIETSKGLFILEDWHNFGYDYSKTLTAWRNNFVKNWSTISHLYDERFYRMWYYYLSFSIGAFRSRKFQLWQIVLSKDGVDGGYQSVR